MPASLKLSQVVKCRSLHRSKSPGSTIRNLIRHYNNEIKEINKSCNLLSKLEMNTSDPPFETTTKPTTTSKPTTTTSENGDYNLRYPDKVMALYIVLADDTEDGYHTGIIF